MLRIRQGASTADLARTNQGLPDTTPKALQNSKQHCDQPHFLCTAVTPMHYVLSTHQWEHSLIPMHLLHSRDATKVGCWWRNTNHACPPRLGREAHRHRMCRWDSMQTMATECDRCRLCRGWHACSGYRHTGRGRNHDRKVRRCSRDLTCDWRRSQFASCRHDGSRRSA